MSKAGKMVGSFADLCIFQTEAGFFVRKETVSRVYARTGRLVTKRHYRDIHSVPAATIEAANDIISQVLRAPLEVKGAVQ